MMSKTKASICVLVAQVGVAVGWSVDVWWVYAPALVLAWALVGVLAAEATLNPRRKVLLDLLDEKLDVQRDGEVKDFVEDWVVRRYLWQQIGDSERMVESLTALIEKYGDEK